jgi:hypothetical protein
MAVKACGMRQLCPRKSLGCWMASTSPCRLVEAVSSDAWGELTTQPLPT